MSRARDGETGTFVTVGVFDGVHLGHQDLILRMVRAARSEGARTACVTFDPHPEVVLHPDSYPAPLSTLADRLNLIRALGVDAVHIVTFTREVSRESPEQFVGRLRQQYPMQSLWVGADFALGHDRAGTVDVLRSIGRGMGFDVVTVPPLEHDGRPVSSTWIRDALGDGNVELAMELLGRAYSVGGPVISGMRRGREIGFPTANIAPPTELALPADGVYFVTASFDESSDRVDAREWYGVVNLGPRPTFHESERLIETHLLDFSGDLYGAQMAVRFLRRLRGVQTFSGIGELRAQIARDVSAAREFASESHPR